VGLLLSVAVVLEILVSFHQSGAVSSFGFDKTCCSSPFCYCWPESCCSPIAGNPSQIETETVADIDFSSLKTPEHERLKRTETRARQGTQAGALLLSGGIEMLLELVDRVLARHLPLHIFAVYCGPTLVEETAQRLREAGFAVLREGRERVYVKTFRKRTDVVAALKCRDKDVSASLDSHNTNKRKQENKQNALE
jgi:hypothetical protein